MVETFQLSVESKAKVFVIVDHNEGKYVTRPVRIYRTDLKLRKI